jgi:hypothetical protein
MQTGAWHHCHPYRTRIVLNFVLVQHVNRGVTIGNGVHVFATNLLQEWMAHFIR